VATAGFRIDQCHNPKQNFGGDLLQYPYFAANAAQQHMYICRMLWKGWRRVG